MIVKVEVLLALGIQRVLHVPNGRPTDGRFPDTPDMTCGNTVVKVSCNVDNSASIILESSSVANLFVDAQQEIRTAHPTHRASERLSAIRNLSSTQIAVELLPPLL